MDLLLGLSIYNKPWLVEPSAAMQMLDLWERAKTGEIKWSYQRARGSEGQPDELTPYQIRRKFFASNRVTIAPDNSYDMRDFQGFEGCEIAVIPVSGPLMKADFCGSFGTNSLRNLSRMASRTDSVRMIVYDIDSPGGTVDGTKAFADEIKSSTKHTVAFVQGQMCSAAYWIGSSCNEIIASCETDEIGCIGTMCSLVDNTEALKARGIVIREYYATDSKNKNAAITEAIQGNGKALISEILDPMNDVFLGAVRANRGDKVNEKALSGKVYTAENALEAGLIDGIKTIDQVFETATKPQGATILKTKKMTAAEFKAAHPAAYAEIFNAGVTDERDRVAEWQAWKDVDPEMVAAGIESGNCISRKESAQLAVKAANAGALKQASAENADEIITPAVVPTPKTPVKGAVDKATTDEFMTLCGIASK